MVTVVRSTLKPADNTQKSRSVQEMLASIQSWPHWDEIRLVVSKEYYVTQEDFYAALPEYQKFLCLAVFYEGLGMYSNLVDMLWHGHLLTTVLYADLCHSVLGKFVHHIPNTTAIKSEEEQCRTCQSCRNCSGGGQGGGNGEGGGSKETFIAAYQAAFGPISPVWELSQADGVTC